MRWIIYIGIALLIIPALGLITLAFAYNATLGFIVTAFVGTFVLLVGCMGEMK